jgi:hypothetical protein
MATEESSPDGGDGEHPPDVPLEATSSEGKNNEESEKAKDTVPVEAATPDEDKTTEKGENQKDTDLSSSSSSVSSSTNAAVHATTQDDDHDTTEKDTSMSTLQQQNSSNDNEEANGTIAVKKDNENALQLQSQQLPTTETETPSPLQIVALEQKSQNVSSLSGTQEALNNGDKDVDRDGSEKEEKPNVLLEKEQELASDVVVCVETTQSNVDANVNANVNANANVDSNEAEAPNDEKVPSKQTELTETDMAVHVMDSVPPPVSEPVVLPDAGATDTTSESATDPVKTNVTAEVIKEGEVGEETTEEEVTAETTKEQEVEEETTKEQVDEEKEVDDSQEETLPLGTTTTDAATTTADTADDKDKEVLVPQQNDKVAMESDPVKAATGPCDDDNMEVDNNNDNDNNNDDDHCENNNNNSDDRRNEDTVLENSATTNQVEDNNERDGDEGDDNAVPMDVDDEQVAEETTSTAVKGAPPALTVAAAPPAPLPPDSDDETKFVGDVFDALSQRKRRRRGRPKRPKLQIVISSSATTTATTNAADASPTRRRMESPNLKGPTNTNTNTTTASSGSIRENDNGDSDSNGHDDDDDDDDDGVVDAVWKTTMSEMQDEMELESELEDSLLFFQETHEDQDESHVIFEKELQEDARKRKLEQLDAFDKTGRQEIEDVINDQLKERQGCTELSAEKYRQRLAADDKRDVQRLQLLLHTKSNSNQTKINQGIKILQRRHQKEMQAAVQHHRQQAQQRRLPEQLAASEWQSTSQQIQTKHQRQLQEFSGKGEELKKKTDLDFKREQEKLRTSLDIRIKEIEANKQKVFSKLYSGLQQLRQRYLKRHVQNIGKMKEDLVQAGSGKKGVEGGTATTQQPNSARDIVKLAMEEKIEHRPASPVKSIPEWAENLPYEQAGAATRHKNRKSVMSQASRQLSVEIHNEGLWISLIKSSSEDTEDSKNRSSASAKESSTENVDEHFIPFGLKAQTILESIVCGEIPDGYDRFDFGEALALQGGQIRCVVADLRTSEQTASSHRAIAVEEQEESNMAELEKKVAELNNMAVEAETAMSRTETEKKESTEAVEGAVKELEKAKRMLDEFKTKFRNFLSPDGTPIPTANPSDRQELLKAMSRYKINLESTSQREKTVRQKLSDTKTSLLKYQTVAKSAQKNANLASNLLKKKKTALASSKMKGARPVKLSEAAEHEKAAARVKDVIAALQKTAGRRRDQSNQKKSSSVSSAWIQSFPGLSNALKRSLWHRIHRRKQQIVLRPTPECLVNELRASVAETVVAGAAVRSSHKKVVLEDELVRAEQMYLLATHPMAEFGMPSVPPSRGNGNWAEPGWQLVLDVPQKPETHQSILPCAPSFPVFDKNLSDICSAPGRQAASMVRTSYLRRLASPLSTFAIASSPAETNASLSLSRKSAAVT